MNNYTSTQEVVKILNIKKDLSFEKNNVIEVLKNTVFDKNRMIRIPNPNKKFDLGNKSWGKIEFLRNQGYRIRYVPQFTKVLIKVNVKVN